MPQEACALGTHLKIRSQSHRTYMKLTSLYNQNISFFFSPLFPGILCKCKESNLIFDAEPTIFGKG